VFSKQQFNMNQLQAIGERSTKQTPSIACNARLEESKAIEVTALGQTRQSTGPGRRTLCQERATDWRAPDKIASSSAGNRDDGGLASPAGPTSDFNR
jgi:hypothetical protein